jgi:tRNA threonylcarbamoyladenosine biosynthesis protein TsaB
MKILAVDTSANVATAAVTDCGRLICESILNHKKTHSEKIMPMIDELLRDSEINIKDIDLFAVANGPGSFTGLRIGVSTVKALAHAVNRPIIGISTLEGLAYNLFAADGLISPIMDARRSQVYNAVYRWESGKLTEVIKPRALALQDCINDFKDEKRVYFLGDGVPVYRDKIAETMGERAVFAPMTCLLQRASSLAALAEIKAENGVFDTYQTLMPFYLRKPQAEREYEEKSKERI